jgi:hypothetical protein
MCGDRIGFDMKTWQGWKNLWYVLRKRSLFFYGFFRYVYKDTFGSNREAKLKKLKKEVGDKRAKAVREALMNHGPFTGK